MAQDEKHPVVAGLIALVGVGLAVGLLLGLMVMAGTQVLGIGGGGGDGESSAVRESMYLPTPQPPSTGPSGPLITLAPVESSLPALPTDLPTTVATPTPEISLQSGQTTVGQMERIDLTGIYTAGEGAILQVQRLENGQWVDFPVSDIGVSGGQFSTYIQTSRTGEQQFRVIDTDTGLASNVVAITVL